MWLSIILLHAKVSKECCMCSRNFKHLSQVWGNSWQVKGGKGLETKRIYATFNNGSLAFPFFRVKLFSISLSLLLEACCARFHLFWSALFHEGVGNWHFFMPSSFSKFLSMQLKSILVPLLCCPSRLIFPVRTKVEKRMMIANSSMFFCHQLNYII